MYRYTKEKTRRTWFQSAESDVNSRNGTSCQNVPALQKNEWQVKLNLRPNIQCEGQTRLFYFKEQVKEIKTNICLCTFFKTLMGKWRLTWSSDSDFRPRSWKGRGSQSHLQQVRRQMTTSQLMNKPCFCKHLTLALCVPAPLSGIKQYRI